ncbi:hypothetical protein CC1G_01072 [Coprinopsis cinerea okayama7|uniref:Uncharacterized protein n=1 Tax=Coprinopsis cinerea (strain Okayama-7 / 130 / ATCC MYA-4618 / FGSC 9003) TaxID=240176 RepID=A8NEF2_COPC7|nr:hypothetical protein CC1G_01072 [Coprinopsis cinerea okayama7\|eukprot:XP_001833010.1 hypothetical protein CC1G_01072 [Coprinopsis cinerea okayama7\
MAWHLQVKTKSDDDIHPRIQPRQVSTYSSLSGALRCSNRLPNTQYRIPQDIYWPQLPHEIDLAQRRPIRAHINFDYVGSQGKGIPVMDLVNTNIRTLSQLMARGEDMVFARGTRDDRGIRFMIRWPGYSHLAYDGFWSVRSRNGKGWSGKKGGRGGP